MKRKIIAVGSFILTAILFISQVSALSFVPSSSRSNLRFGCRQPSFGNDIATYQSTGHKPFVEMKKG